MKTIQLFRFKSKFDNFCDNVSVYLKPSSGQIYKKGGTIMDELRYLIKLKYLMEKVVISDLENKYCGYFLRASSDILLFDLMATS